MSKHILCGILLASLLLSGCASNPDVQVVELSRNTVVYDEIVRINNCGGKGDSEQIASQEFKTTIELGAGGGADYQFVEANLSAKYSEARSTSKSQRLVAPPGTNMEFVLRWSYDVRAGNVQVNGKSGTYEVRIPVSVEQISSRDLGCGSEQQANQPIVTPIQPTIAAYCAYITSDQVEQLRAIQGVSNAIRKAEEFAGYRQNDYRKGQMIPSGVLIATDLQSSDVERYGVIPVNNQGGWGLFITTRQFQAPNDGTYWCIR